MLQTILIGILAFLGILGGRLLAKIAEEEIKPGMKYFLALQRVILLALLLALMAPVMYTWTQVIPFLAGAVLSSLFKQRYFYHGLSLVAASALSPTIFFIVASLIFFYGLPYGTLNKEVKQLAIFFAIPFVLLLFPMMLKAYVTTWLAFAAGTQLDWWQKNEKH